MTIEHQQIKDYIPHRDPFLFVDRIIEIKANNGAIGIKKVTGAEFFFPGHFPEMPIMPGVIIIEAMAQVASVLAIYSRPEIKGEILYFAGIDGARFKKPVVPGDILRLEISVIKIKKRMIKVRGKAVVDEGLVCEAELTAMIQTGKKES
jgi:beta-hydroxyacyl-ACP dehydratase FabZ